MRPRLARRRISPGSVVWLTAVWVLLWGVPTPLTVVGGLLVAVTVLLLFPLPRVQVSMVVRPTATVVLLARFFWDLVRASLEVSWLAVARGPTTRGAVMDIELAGDEELLQTITAEMVALVPGTVVIDLELHERLLTLHALDVTNLRQAQTVRRRVLAQEARVLRAFHPDPDSVLNPRRRPPLPADAHAQARRAHGVEGGRDADGREEER